MIQRLTEKISNPIERKALRSLGLLLVILISLVIGIAEVVQGLSFEYLFPISLIALFLAWWLASTRVSGWKSAGIHILIAFGWVLLQVGRLGGEINRVFDALVTYISEGVETRILPDGSDLQAAYTELVSDVSVLLSRVSEWISSVLEGSPSFDPVAVTFVWGLAVWAIAAWQGWAIRRWLRPVIGVIPAVFVLGYSLAHAGERTIYLLPVLSATLFLAIMVKQDAREEHWKRSGARYPRFIRRNVTWVAIMVSMGLVTIAAFAPKFSIENIQDFIAKITEDRDSSKSVGSAGGAGSDSEVVRVYPFGGEELINVRIGGLPNTHLIGSGSELSEQVVMVISANEVLPEGTDEDRIFSTEDYYWRNLTFDNYQGNGWFTGTVGLKTFAADDIVISSSIPGQRLLRSEVSMLEDKKGLLYYSGTLVTADHNYGIAQRVETSTFGNPDLFGAYIGSATYQVDSLVSVFSAEELRAADGTIPADIAEHYLALPNTIPDRVISLAIDLTATQPTAYDRAMAIETFLRAFPYTLNIPLPPEGENIDIVDYFLFTLRKGYCDYYATSMVVLARAAGLPSRMVYGYIGENYDEENNRYIITEDLAHSWVEIYFPEYGWIEFEPTAGRREIDRPEKALPIVPAELDVGGGFQEQPEEEPEQDIPQFAPDWAFWGRVTSWVTLSGLAIVLLWPFVDIWRLGLMSPNRVVYELFRRLYSYARPFGVTPPKEKTPFEFAETFSRHFARLLKFKRSDSLLNETTNEIDWLAHEFVRVRYGNYLPDNQVKRTAIQNWKHLRKLLWSARWEAWHSSAGKVK